jgi:hypothetical protein
VLNKIESCFTTDINQSIIPILDALYKLDTEKEENQTSKNIIIY